MVQLATRPRTSAEAPQKRSDAAPSAVILAGGAGTRLRPLTCARRKELIPLLNRPLLEYRLIGLRDNGVTDIVLACSRGVNEIERYFGDGSSLGVRLRYHYEDHPLGSGRAVKEAARAFGLSGTLVVCNGDILTDLDLRGMLALHRQKRAAISISLARVDEPWHFGVVAVDDDLAISRFVEKPPKGDEPSDLINGGTWLWEPSVLDRIPGGATAVRDGYAERVLFPNIIADGGIVQGFVEQLWVDVGAPDRYLHATRLLLERNAAAHGEGCWIAPDATLLGPVCLGRNVTVRGGAHITGPSVLGNGCVIGAEARIESSVLWDGVFVGAAAIISDSIIGTGAGVGDGAVLANAILADDALVGAGCVADGLRLMPGGEFLDPNSDDLPLRRTA